MRRLIIFICSLAVSIVAGAAVSIPLLDRMPGHRVTFDYIYTAADGQEVASGEVIVQGNSYKLSAMGLEIVSDGTTRWTLDRKACEVLIENVDNVDPSTNPALLVMRYRDYSDRLKVHSAGEDSLDISIALSEETVARFRLSGIVFAEEGEPGDFVLDVEGLGNGYIVTDLR